MFGSNDDDSKRCAFEVYRLIYKADKITEDRMRHIVRKILDTPTSEFRVEAVFFLRKLCKSSTDDLLLYAHGRESDLARKDIIGNMITDKRLYEKFPEIEKHIHEDVLIQFFLINSKEEIQTRGLNFLTKIIQNHGPELTANIIKTILKSEYISEKRLGLIKSAVQKVPEVWRLCEKEIDNSG